MTLANLPQKLLYIELQHQYTKERVTMPVEDIARTYVAIRWNLSGIYDLNLLENKLTARSAAARRRNPCLWTAVDIKAVREAVKVHMAKQDLKGIVRADTVRHNASMPNYPSYPYGKRR